MEFDELLITTGVDALVRLVKERQRIELEEASLILNIPQETIEDWARVLEEEGILRIEYRLTKVFLGWVKPTEEEIATEKQSFYEEKKGIEEEVEGFRQKITSETGSLEDLQKSFAEFYTKTYAKMDALEKSVSPLPASKTISEDVFAKYQTELSEMDGKLDTTKASMDDIRKEISSLGVGKGSSEELIERVEKMNSELLDLQGQMEDLRKKAAQQELPSEVSMPTVKDIKKKFDAMQKDFVALRSKNAQMRQDMLSLHESTEILKSVAESIMGQEDKIATIRTEVSSLSEEANKLFERSNEIASKLKQNLDLVERLGDSIETAKSVQKKFPSQDKVMEELDKVKADEEALAEKSASLEKIIDAVGGRQVTAKQFAELSRQMDEKSTQIRKDMDALEAALHDEKSTYLTFQKIKERIVPSIEAYQSSLDSMDQRITKIKEEAEEQTKNVKAEAQKFQDSIKGGQMEGVVKTVEDIREKKKMLDEIRNSLDELVTMSDNLNKRITLLSREAKLLEIRTGGSAGGTQAPSGGEGGGGGIPTEKSVRTQLQLSQDEELEFRKKREELKKLIQKLWEQ